MADAAAAKSCSSVWIPTWASSQMLPTGENLLPKGVLGGATLRQVVRTSVAGQRLRVRLSNVASPDPLGISGVTVAQSADPASSAIKGETLRRVLFDGRREVMIPAGAEYLSDPVALAPAALESLVVSIHHPEEPAAQTSHPGSRATSYVLPGDHLNDPAMPGAKTFDHWFSLASVEAETCAPAGAIVALGDSITDGRGATTNGNDRWTDRLAARLQGEPRLRHLAVLNQGIGGNRLLKDGLGPNALARLDRDVLAQPGARYLIVLEGINDIGTLTREAPVSEAAHAELVSRMIGAYRQIVQRAHARGIKVIGATILPFGSNTYYHPDARNEADRQAVNRWIRQPGNFDAFVDLDAVMRDPARPDRLRAEYDVGDGLHPSPAGYRAMADAIPLKLFQ
ncbi:MAG: SGNH/GDSL hydrolase family protein [Sphingobium sp.]|nr:SGNH/GDSL hydrolase family protein [Sphingobium sp.]MDX3910741.1 SGNH/GDSL hydrolase family protein [Sphingobium sp.]